VKVSYSVMKDFYIFIVLLQLIAIGAVVSQRVAPGVNPQHYQHNQQYQQPPPQGNPQYQQQQYQQQAPVHQQQQQVHQQQQQQVHQQQVPVQQQQAHHQQPPQGQQQGHGHAQQAQGHGHHHNAPVLTGNVQAEKEHIAEHMEVPMDTSKMSEQELQFHYFKMHDADNNNKLDGCELIKSLIHWHVSDKLDPESQYIYPDSQLAEVIDISLKMDRDKDGYIDFAEYRNPDISPDYVH